MFEFTFNLTITIIYNFLSDIDSIEQFDSYVKKIVNQKFLNSFTTVHTSNETDQVLQTISYWPETSSVEYFRNKLKFQIQHSLFRYLDIVRYFVLWNNISVNF